MDDPQIRLEGKDPFERLLDVARRQVEALRRGDVDACAGLNADRERLFEALPRDWSGYAPTDRERMERAIRQILAVDRDSVILLQGILEETARAVVGLGVGQEGGVAYIRAKGFSEPGDGIIDRTC